MGRWWIQLLFDSLLCGWDWFLIKSWGFEKCIQYGMYTCQIQKQEGVLALGNNIYFLQLSVLFSKELTFRGDYACSHKADAIYIQQYYINQGSRVCPLWHQPSKKNRDWCGSLINWWNNIERLKCFWQMVINPGSCVRLGLPMLLVVQNIHTRWTPSAHRYIIFIDGLIISQEKDSET